MHFVPGDLVKVDPARRRYVGAMLYERPLSELSTRPNEVIAFIGFDEILMIVSVHRPYKDSDDDLFVVTSAGDIGWIGSWNLCKCDHLNL